MVLMLAFAAFVMVESIILRMLIIRFPEPPEWMQKFSTFIKNNFCLKYLIMMPADFMNPDVKATDKEEQPWINFCRFIERLIVIIILVSFIFYNGY